ncbi:14 kDa proline-rich protein DC2.15-like [Papaver somniferum]|uniref:14 kDa proline-rich protein DC2.15-like n=1 Tax=Papaver somniferum TaxID=3469 RepID=UPI000E704889|nr:14 kDa proline-rich protein DC2.15-like [Papaver somniferum]
MAALASTILIVSLNLLFFTLVTSCYTCTPTPNPTKPIHPPAYMPPKINPSPKSPVPSTKLANCPRDTLKLAVCANVLNGLVNIVVGTPPNSPCCTLINGLVGLEAAVCLCTALRAQVLGVVNLDVSIALSLLLNTCGRNVPSGFLCA